MGVPGVVPLNVLFDFGGLEESERAAVATSAFVPLFLFFVSLNFQLPGFLFVMKPAFKEPEIGWEGRFGIA